MNEAQPIDDSDGILQPPALNPEEVGRMNSDVNQEVMATAANTHSALEEEMARLKDNGVPKLLSQKSDDEWVKERATTNIGGTARSDPSSGLDLEAHKRVSDMTKEASDLNEARDELIAARIDVSQISIEDLPRAIGTLRSYKSSESYLSSMRSNLQQAEEREARDAEALAALPHLPKETEQPQT